MSDTVPSSKNGLAIAGLVLGIIGVCLCWVPFVNNAAVILGIIGLIMSVFAVVKSNKLKARKGMSIAALVLNVIAIVASLAIQQMMVAAIDDAMNGGDAAKQVAAVSAPAASSSDSGSSSSASTSAPKSDNKDQDLKLGEAASFKNGAVITVVGVEKGLTASYTDKTFSRVEITIENTGKDSISMNPFYWKAENPQGVQAGYSFFSDAVNEMKAGDLAAGGKTTANIYFEDDCVKVLYTPGLSNTPSATWVVS